MAQEKQKTAIGYVRVSTNKQDTDAQEGAILKTAHGKNLKLENIEQETISSRKQDRKIYGVADSLKAGQVLIVYEMSRLARSIPEVYEIVKRVKARKASILIISPVEIWLGAGLDPQQEMNSDLYIFMLGQCANMEKRLIAERTKNALRARKEQGVKLGRPAGKGRKVEAILKEKNVDIEGLKNIGLSAVKIGKLIGVDRRTVSDYLKAIEQEKKNHEARKLKKGEK
mgnify:FL=1